MSSPQPSDTPWADRLRSPDPAVRRQALKSAEADRPAAEQTLRILCDSLRNDPVWTVREAAAQSLGTLAAGMSTPNADVAQALRAAALRDRVEHVRRAAAWSSFGPSLHSESTRTYVAAFESSRTSVRCRALAALCTLDAPPPEALATIRIAVRDSDSRVRATALQLLTRHPAFVTELTQEIERRLYDRDPRVARLARVLIRDIDDETPEGVAAIAPHPRGVLAVASVFGSAISPAGREEFLATCRRRAVWNTAHRKAAPVTIPDEASTREAAQAVVAALEQRCVDERLHHAGHPSQRSAERSSEREWVWLLMRSREIIANEPDRR